MTAQKPGLMCPYCDEYAMPKEWEKCIDDRRNLV